jgi:hypothetical protein
MRGLELEAVADAVPTGEKMLHKRRKQQRRHRKHSPINWRLWRLWRLSHPK